MTVRTASVSAAAFLLAACATAAAQEGVSPPVRESAQGQEDLKELEAQVEQLRRRLEEMRRKTGFVLDVEAVRERLAQRAPRYRAHQEDPPPARPAQPPGTQPPGTHGDTPEGTEVRSGPPAPATPGGPAPAAPRVQPRLLGDAEKTALPAGTAFTVDGLPVARQELDDLVAYLRTYKEGQDDEALHRRAMREILKVKAVEAAYRERVPSLKERILEARRTIEDEGRAFEEVARQFSDCPSGVKGGDLEFFGREAMVLPMAKVAFQAPLGELVGPVTTYFGYHLVRVTGRSPGQKREQDHARASHILVMFDRDRAALDAVAGRVDRGEVDLAFAEAGLRRYVPEVFLRARERVPEDREEATEEVREGGA